MVYTVIQGLFLRKNAIPFFIFMKQQTAFSTPVKKEHITGSNWWTVSLFLDWLCYFMFVLQTMSEDPTWRYGSLLMFVCHNNMFVLMFVVISVLPTVSFFCSCLTYLRKFYLENYRSGLHSLYTSGTLCDQSVTFSCIMCLCLIISVKLNKTF